MALRTHARRQANRAHGRADLVAVGALALVGGWAYFFGWQSQAFAIFAITVAIVAIGWKEALRHRGNRWASGARGEEAVARRLKRLRRRGWVAVHDIDTGRGNIDHVAVGPGGVVAIETKNHARLDRVTPRMYAQARRNAARVATATGRDAQAVLVLTRAPVHRKDRRNDDAVTVLTLDRLNRHLRRLPPVLTANEIADAVARTAALAPGETRAALR